MSSRRGMKWMKWAGKSETNMSTSLLRPVRTTTSLIKLELLKAELLMWRCWSYYHHYICCLHTPRLKFNKCIDLSPGCIINNCIHCSIYFFKYLILILSWITRYTCSVSVAGRGLQTPFHCATQCRTRRTKFPWLSSF